MARIKYTQSLMLYKTEDQGARGPVGWSSKLHSILCAKIKLIWGMEHALGELRTQFSQGESGEAEVS